MRVLALDHVNIRTPLFAETIAFYEEVVGLRAGPGASAVSRARNVWLYAGDHPVIHVNGPKEGEDVADAGAGSRLDHFALSCAGLAAMRARLAHLGVPHREQHRVERDLHQINLVDPNGIRLELTFTGES